MEPWGTPQVTQKQCSYTVRFFLKCLDVLRLLTECRHYIREHLKCRNENKFKKKFKITWQHNVRQQRVNRVYKLLAHDTLRLQCTVKHSHVF